MNKLTTSFLILIFLTIKSFLFAFEITNNADYITAIILKRHIAEERIFEQKVLSIVQGELDISDFQKRLEEYNIHANFVIAGSISTLSELGDGDILVYELISFTNVSMPQLGMIEKNNGKLYVYNFTEKTKAELNSDDFLRFMKTHLTSRFLIVKNAYEQIKKQEEEVSSKISSHNMKGDSCFLEYLESETLRLPVLINLGSVPVGGVLIPTEIPITNLSSDKIQILGIEKNCVCISDATYPTEIEKGKTGLLSFSVNTDYYTKEATVDTTLMLSTSDQNHDKIKIRVIGVIDESKNLIADPARIFDTIKSTFTERRYTINFFKQKNEKSDIHFVSLNDSKKLFTFEFTKNKGNSYGKYENCAQLNLMFSSDDMKTLRTDGHIAITIIYGDVLRTYSIPYTLIKE